MPSGSPKSRALPILRGGMSLAKRGVRRMFKLDTHGSAFPAPFRARGSKLNLLFRFPNKPLVQLSQRANFSKSTVIHLLEHLQQKHFSTLLIPFLKKHLQAPRRPCQRNSTHNLLCFSCVRHANKDTSRVDETARRQITVSRTKISHLQSPRTPVPTGPSPSPGPSRS